MPADPSSPAAEAAAVEALAEVLYDVATNSLAPEWRYAHPDVKPRYRHQAQKVHAKGYRLVPPGSRVVSEGQGVVDGEVVGFEYFEHGGNWSLVEPQP